jgi:hypothetical protein
VEDDRVDIAGLGLEVLPEQVEGALLVGSGEAEVGRVVATRGSREQGRKHGDDDPPHHHQTTVVDAQSG